MASQLLWEESPVFAVENNFDNEKGRYVQGDFLSMFSYGLSQGDPKTALKRPDGIVISQKIADKYFKGKDPMKVVVDSNLKLPKNCKLMNDPAKLIISKIEEKTH